LDPGGVSTAGDSAFLAPAARKSHEEDWTIAGSMPFGDDWKRLDDSISTAAKGFGVWGLQRGIRQRAISSTFSMFHLETWGVNLQVFKVVPRRIDGLNVL